ncbi:thiamine phosphate synthase [Fodinibius sp.]|uniref:thiamine phosphate synthase n=1 Tax=Fodinibius sp. TaxID=1872440 RepID=UPI00356712DF
MMDPGFRYYLITDRKQCHPRPLTEVVEQACRQGIRAVQLREKDLGGRALFALAGELRVITRRWKAKLFINDRTDVALAAGADGVHCRETGINPGKIKCLRSSLIVGSSVHSIESSRRAEQEGADFLLFGPVFYTASKAKYGAPQGTAALQEVVESVAVPVFAVGGITPERARECRSAGAYGVAGISSIMMADSVGQRVNQWKSTLHTL